MKYLLDTHTILWYLFGHDRLSKSAKDIIESNVCFYSYASFWEISIKQSKKKLEFTHTVYEIDEMCRRAGFRKLPITLDDTVIEYFKNMSEETGMPYQNIINYYLLDCVKNKKHLQVSFGK